MTTARDALSPDDPLRTDDPILTVSEAARRLGLCGQRVRELADEGRLPVIRTYSGLRLFRLSHIEALRRARIAKPNRR